MSMSSPMAAAANGGTGSLSNGFHGMSISTPKHQQINGQDDDETNNNINEGGTSSGIPTIIPSYDDPQLIDPHAISPIILEVARLGAWDEVNKLAISHPGSAKFKRDGL